MGIILVTILAYFDPAGFFEAAIYAVVSLGLFLGLVYAPIRVWLSAVLISVSNFVVVPILMEEQSNISLPEMFLALVNIVEAISYVVLYLVSVVSFLFGKKYHDSAYRVLVGVLSRTNRTDVS